MINGKQPSTTGRRSQKPSRATQAMPPSKEAAAKAKAKARGAPVSASQVKQESSTARANGSNQGPVVSPSPPQARKESPKAGFRGPPGAAKP